MKVIMPQPLSGPHAKSALSALKIVTTASIKVHITDTFANLNNFAVLAGTMTASGNLSGTGAVRHVDQVATDNYKVSAVIGANNFGKTWLVTCGSKSFDRFYALEIESAAQLGVFSIIKGTGVTASTSSGIFGALIGLLGFIVGFFKDVVTNIRRDDSQNVMVDVGDKVTVWWDEPNSIVRAYKNDVEKIAFPVPPHEIPHGENYRYFGVVGGVADPDNGVYFTSIEAQDV